MKYSVVVAAVAGVAFGSVAHAKPKQIKAHLLCGTIVDGKVKQVITGGKVGKLTDPIACAMHVDDPNEPSHMGNVHTVRYPSGGKKLTSGGKTDDFGSQLDANKKDFEIVMTPNVGDPDNHEIPFVPCEDFDIVATIAERAECRNDPLRSLRAASRVTLA